jgi:hypothetical protein
MGGSQSNRSLVARNATSWPSEMSRGGGDSDGRHLTNVSRCVDGSNRDMMSTVGTAETRASIVRPVGLKGVVCFAGWRARARREEPPGPVVARASEDVVLVTSLTARESFGRPRDQPPAAAVTRPVGSGSPTSDTRWSYLGGEVELMGESECVCT